MLTPEQNERLRDLFAEACELPGPARAAFCADQCADDPELRAELEALLAVEPNPADSFLAHPAPLPAGAPAPEWIGPYHLLERIGEGGMGVVYHATQDAPVRREVALKLIKPGMDSARVLSRFEAERQALARMDHPHIARIHDAGVMDDGRPFFAMELVRGEPLTAWCDRHRLDLPSRLRVLAAVCDAVQHAHQKGIVHRDLKPSNILVTVVDGVPTPKVIDFGIARAMTDTEDLRATLTSQGEMVGTLQYMSPEQAAGDPDIDARADIYALGVVLYELITGQLPFEAESLLDRPLDEVRRMVREQEPLRPSTRITSAATSTDTADRRSTDSRSLRRSLVGDLDWITLRALDKDRERRYPSASELAADLRRYLAHEPVSAGPPSRRYKLRKFVRRNRTAVLATAAVCVAVLAGLGATATALVWALDEEEKARVARGKEQEARTAAETSARDAAARADELQRVVEFQSAQLGGLDATKLGAQIQSDIWDRVRENLVAGAGPDGADEVDQGLTELGRLAQGVDFHALALRLLDRNVFRPTLEVLDRQFGDQPKVQARLLMSTAHTMDKLGLGPESLPAAQRALLLAENNFGASDDATIDAMLLVGYLRMQEEGADLDEIDALLVDAKTRAEARGVRPDGILVEALRDLSTLRMKQDRVDDAIELSRDAVTAAEVVFGPDSVATANAVFEYGNRLVYDFQFEAAGRHLDRAATILEGAGLADRASEIRRYFASELLNSHLVQLAIPVLRDEADKLEDRLGPDALATVETRHSLASAYAEGGQYEAAERELLEILPRLAQLPRGTERLQHANRLLTLTRVQLGSAEAPPTAPALARPQPVGQLQSSDILELEKQAEQARWLIQQGRFADAEPLLRPCFEALAGLDQDELEGLVDEVLAYGLVLRHLNRRGDAERVDRTCLEIHQRIQSESGGRPIPGTAYSAFQLGVVLAETGRWVEAEQMLALAVETHRVACPNNPWELQKLLDSHGRAVLELGAQNAAEAASILEESLTLLEECTPEMILEIRSDHDLQVEIGRRARWCAMACAKADQPQQAVEFLRRARAKLESCFPADHPRHWEIHECDCLLALNLGRSADAALVAGDRIQARRLASEALARYEAGMEWIFAQPAIHPQGAAQPELAAQVTSIAAWAYAPMHAIEPGAGYDQGEARWQARLEARQNPGTGAPLELPFEEGVTAIHRDRAGNLWIGSAEEGVCRFDGQQLVRFTAADGLSDDRVRRIQEGPDGRIWFECGEGLSSFDGEQIVTPTERVHETRDAWQSTADDLWFKSDAAEGVTEEEGVPGVYRFDGERLTWLGFPIESEADADFYPSVAAVARGAEGRTWFATHAAVLGYDGQSFSVFDAARLGLAADAGAVDALAVLEDRQGRLWIGTNWNGVFVCEGDTVAHFSAEREPEDLSRVLTIAEDAAGHIWFGTPRKGAWRWDGEKLTAFGPEQGLESLQISTLHVDADGTLRAGGGRPSAVYRFDGEAFVRGL